ncbi:MAG: alpha/beta hydrolase [Tagaea sp.]|nr:alpha/beta hydrolase [Tagaea sp.]
MGVERVAFEVEGERIAADLHLPGGPGPHPAVVVAGPMTSVKEQVTGVYAAALARRGLAALSLDHRGFGQSGGAPRQLEDWRRKVADLRAGLDMLAARGGLDPLRLGAAAICLGCGYAAHAAAGNARVKALGLVAGYFRDPAALRAKDPAAFDVLIAQGEEARRRYETTGIVETIPAAAAEGDAAMRTSDTVDYYTSRAAHPNYVNRFAVMSREHFLPFDAQAAAARLTQPVVMVHSRNALSPHWAEAFFAKLPGEKSLEWIDSQGQTDIYDSPAIVERATDILARGLLRSLG